MRKLLFTALLIISPLSLTLSAKEKRAMHVNSYAEVHTNELKSWYDQGKAMTVVDARSHKNYNGVLLPGAIWIPHDAPEADLKKQLPSKEGVIVVYCCNVGCSSSTWMAERLTAAGYKNVYRYTEGLQGWEERGLPTVRQ